MHTSSTREGIGDVDDVLGERYGESVALVPSWSWPVLRHGSSLTSVRSPCLHLLQRKAAECSCGSHEARGPGCYQGQAKEASPHGAKEEEDVSATLATT